MFYSSVPEKTRTSIREFEVLQTMSSSTDDLSPNSKKNLNSSELLNRDISNNNIKNIVKESSDLQLDDSIEHYDNINIYLQDYDNKSNKYYSAIQTEILIGNGNDYNDFLKISDHCKYIFTIFFQIYIFQVKSIHDSNKKLNNYLHQFEEELNKYDFVSKKEQAEINKKFLQRFPKM